MKNSNLCFLTILIVFLSILIPYSNETNAQNVGSNTGYKIPRYVSLKSDDANLRVGSSKNYPIILNYITKNMPLEIIEEYDDWRKINDIEGNTGWIHKNLLKGERFAIINQPYINLLQIYKKPKGKVIGEIGKRNIVRINNCLTEWCKISFQDKKGWVLKINLWGVYENEKINIPFYQPLVNFIWKLNL